MRLKFCRPRTQIKVMEAALGSESNLVALIEEADRGNKSAADALFSVLYSELRRLAKHELARHGAPVSLSATTLMHKAYIEFAGRDGTSFADRNRFMGYAARVMRGFDSRFESPVLDFRFPLLSVLGPDQIKLASALRVGCLQLSFRDRSLRRPPPSSIGGLDSFPDAHLCVRHNREYSLSRAQLRFLGTNFGTTVSAG